MKNLLFCCLIATSIISCSPNAQKSNAVDYPANAAGYNLDSSANIDLVKKMVKSFEAMDSIGTKSSYAENAKFHENGNEMSLKENLTVFNMWKSKGISIKVEKIEPIWEAVNKKASDSGYTNYVIGYQTIVFTKGDKSVKVINNVVDAIKNGKIAEEWIIYDSKELYSLLQ
jgi:hypothetical protein